ncbi:hypothetical protein [Listeria portnoyi]|nr:hypothetical protein [Listeria portnoyi]
MVKKGVLRAFIQKGGKNESSFVVVSLYLHINGREGKLAVS